MQKVIVLSLIIIVRLYQVLISSITIPTCRFQPSCSHYALQALRQHGLLGLVLTVKRFSRCHPLGGHGYDPVPTQINKQLCNHERNS